MECGGKRPDVCKSRNDLELYMCMIDLFKREIIVYSAGKHKIEEFGDLEFVRYVMSINLAKKINTYNMGKYFFAVPFTKESLLYREIFETYYPKQVQMLPDFWMPNKEWEGCAVHDPSARVLKNYGNSDV